MAIPNYIISINKGKRKKKGKKKENKLYLYDSAINIVLQCILYLLTRKEREEGKEREKSFLFCLYDSAINIHVCVYAW